MSISMIPNLITMIRIIGSVCLLFVKPLSALFYVIYTIAGLSDAVDGFIARKTHSISELGSKLDSIADLAFYIVMILRILPVLLVKLPFWIWYIVMTVVVLRIASYAVAAIRFRRFASLHTMLNKAATLMIFFVPYLIRLDAVLSVFCTIISITGVISSLEELVIHLTRKSYRSNVSSTDTANK